MAELDNEVCQEKLFLSVFLEEHGRFSKPFNSWSSLIHRSFSVKVSSFRSKPTER